MNNITQIETISVIGLGYIGLPTAAMFASKEKKVIGIDINKDVVKTINAGKIHIVEPDLDLIIDKAVKNGFLKTATVPEPADAFLIAVPTPFLPKNSDEEIPEPDLSFIKSATEIGPLVRIEARSSFAKGVSSSNPSASTSTKSICFRKSPLSTLKTVSSERCCSSTWAVVTSILR